MSAGEIVCPEFYVDEWEVEGRKRTFLPEFPEFPNAADDGVCRLKSCDRGTDGVWRFNCRCGRRFELSEAKTLKVL